MVLARNYTAEDLQDVGLYLQGLLQIMAADDHLHETEKELVKQYALRAGFEEKYIERNIDTALSNKYFVRLPPRFHSRDTAEDFLLEAARIAVCDGSLHLQEEEWLRKAVEKNDLDWALIEPILEGVPRTE